MTLRRLLAVLFVAALATPGTASAASFTTTNFTVSALDDQLARRFGEMAEKYRKEKAEEWLGQEMPTWQRRCPLRVDIAQGGAGGATTFTFGDPSHPGVASQQMEIHGPVRQLLYSVLPHEITHTVLAYHFGRPVPRWADEGGSVLSENKEERDNHDIRCRELLNAGRGIRLKVLCRMTEYPRDMIVLYAQGYSVSAYLVERGGDGVKGRSKLLQFLAQGMQGSTREYHGSVESWNAAAQRVYGVESLDALEGEWLDALRNPQARVAARATGTTTGGKPAEYASVGGVKTDVRSSAAPALPKLDAVLEAPVKAVRGTAPDFEPAGTAASARPPTPAVRPVAPDRPPPVLLPPELPPPARP
ncbi:MAG: hypothetical protein JWO38_4771 [Gemmataceae bacterium]|nr:hypothetical protein [Gemmataceae bacterium]